MTLPINVHATPDGIHRILNWKPSRPSINARALQLELKNETDLPQEKDLTKQFPDPFDQLNIGSCVDNASVGLYSRILKQINYKFQFVPSRLFAYYNARSLEGNTSSDAGSTIADGIRALNEFGVCPEQELDGTSPDWIWPYDTSKFAQKPPEQCYKDALLHMAVKDHVVNLDRLTVLNALAAEIPFCFGFTVHKSFMTQQMADTGVMHVPGAWDFTDPEVGGHGIDIVGYVLNRTMGTQGIKDWALIRNSWGTQWGTAGESGVRGHFWMPLDEILCNARVSSDAHAIDVTSESVKASEHARALANLDGPADSAPSLI